MCIRVFVLRGLLGSSLVIFLCFFVVFLVRSRLGLVLLWSGVSVARIAIVARLVDVTRLVKVGFGLARVVVVGSGMVEVGLARVGVV